MRLAYATFVTALALTALSASSVWTAPVHAQEAEAQTPEHLVSVGVRAGAHDPTALAVGGKLQLIRFGRPSLSLRAALLYGEYFEGRAAVTAELRVVPRVLPFLGAGVAYGTDGLGAIDPMLTGGLDIRLIRRVVLQLSVGLIFQLRAEDDDKEAMAALAFAF